MKTHLLKEIKSSWWRPLLWAAAMACLAAPVASALWTPNRSPAFYPLLGASAVAAALVGSIWKPERADWLSPPLLFAAVYPVSVMLGLSIQNVEDGVFSVGLAIIAVGIGVVIGTGPLLIGRFAPNPGRGLRWGGTLWAILSVLTLPAMGLGVLGAPEAVGYLLASRSAPDRAA